MSLRLYIVRHGKAERDSATGRDSDRPLRPRGIHQATWLGQRLASGDKPPRIILSSPFVRALDTARILHQAVACPLEIFDQLAVGPEPGEVVELIRVHAHVKALAVVGHNPQLSELALNLAEPSSAAPRELRTGEAFVIDFKSQVAPGQGRFRESLRMDNDD
ncbi:MAG: histidine phosphatase family protein [Phycisphaerae bacterium]|nr:histidine phosphatase family protein [Phycisphaerae bacterium]